MNTGAEVRSHLSTTLHLLRQYEALGKAYPMPESPPPRKHKDHEGKVTWFGPDGAPIVVDANASPAAQEVSQQEIAKAVEFDARWKAYHTIERPWDTVMWPTDHDITVPQQKIREWRSNLTREFEALHATILLSGMGERFFPLLWLFNKGNANPDSVAQNVRLYSAPRGLAAIAELCSSHIVARLQRNIAILQRWLQEADCSEFTRWRIDQDVRAVLDEARAVTNLRQPLDELADKIGVSLSTIKAWRTGKHMPTGEKRVALEDYLIDALCPKPKA